MSENKIPGDSNRITREYFDSILLEMRLIDSDLPNIEMNLYGETFSTPITTAALSHLNSTHPEGLVEMARGAKGANALMFAGMGEDEEIQNICATGAKTIKIIKPYQSNDEIVRRIKVAEACGALGVGMDIDHAFGHHGGYDVVRNHHMRPKSTGEIAEFVRSTSLPFIIKGVLSVQDAEKCLKAGVRGIVVSNHHGIMDYLAPPLMVLPKIVEVIDGAMPIFLDCCVESGLDVFKALALGATAVSVGRALMPPLGEGGAQGVKQAIESMNTELSRAMAMTCAKDLKSIDPDCVYLR